MAGSVSDYVHGLEQYLAALKADLHQQLGKVQAPGKALITSCPACNGEHCRDCEDTGLVLMKACPNCGDVGFDVINGQNDHAEMVCGLAVASDGQLTSRGGWRSGCQFVAGLHETGIRSRSGGSTEHGRGQ